MRIANDMYSDRRKGKRKDRLSGEEISQLKIISNLLKPFADLTDIWQGDGITSSTVIVGLIQKLQGSL